MDAVDTDHVAARPRRRHRPRRRRAQRAAMLTITEGDLTDVPITHEELPDERPSSPLPAPVPTFEYGITTADPAASWALFRTLSIQHDIMSSICEQLEIPRPAAIPYRLGPDPGPSRPPWSFFPPADPPVVSTAGPTTGPTAAAADPDPALPTGFASPDRSLTEQLLAVFDAHTSVTHTSTDEIVSQAMAAMDFSIPSPTSVFDRDAEEEFDPDTDDLLDDF